MRLPRLAWGCRRRRILALAVAAMAAVITTADDLPPEVAIDGRQTSLRDLGGSFKAIRDQLQRPRPVMISVQMAAQDIAYAAQDIAGWFPAGSGPESGLETDAKPGIWSDPEGFAAALAAFEEEAPKLLPLARAQDIDGLKAQYRVVGRTCKGCHDQYRVPED